MSASLPLVSIIIPTYNMRQWIAEAIDSALAQSYPNCEIIVMDDGSTDGTGEYVRNRYGDTIRYIYQDNRGRGAARNVAIRASGGTYIQFLDADDLLDAHKIAVHVDFLEKHPQYAVVYGAPRLFVDGKPDETWAYPAAKHYASGNLLAPMIQYGGLIQLLPALMRREWFDKINGFDETMPRCEDYDFWLRMAHAGAEFAYMPQHPVGLYRKAPEQRSGTGQELLHAEGILIALHKMRNMLPLPEQKRVQLRQAIGAAYLSDGKANLRYGNGTQALKSLLQSLWYGNLSARIQAPVYSLALFLPYTRVNALVEAIIRGQNDLKKRVVRVRNSV